jgi:hypothetical protein
MLTQDEAVQILEESYQTVHGLVDRLPAEMLTAKGIGGAMWTPQDLIGHIAFWETAALEALDAWSEGGAAPIDRALNRGLNGVNAQALRTIRSLTLDEVRKHAEKNHYNLLLAIQEMGPDLWDSLPTARHSHSIGESLGRILVGPDGPYTHARAHIPDLEEFVARSAG